MKNKKLEIKIYEKLGIKKFKELVLAFKEGLFHLNLNYNSNVREDNYTLKPGKNIQNIVDFKKKILFNSIVHIVGLSLSLLPFFLSFFFSLFGNILELIFVYFFSFFMLCMNGYALMLQRYNYLRIQDVMTKYYVLQKCSSMKKRRVSCRFAS